MAGKVTSQLATVTARNGADMRNKEKEMTLSEAICRLDTINDLGFLAVQQGMKEGEVRKIKKDIASLKNCCKDLQKMFNEVADTSDSVVQKKIKKSVKWFDDEVNTGMGPVMSCRLFLRDEPVAAC